MTSRPTVGPAAPWAFPEPVEHTFDNGLTAEIYCLPGQYVTSTRMLLPAPAAAEPRDVEGVGTIVSRTMDEGTESHSAEELAELFEGNGIAISAGMTSRGVMFDLEAVPGRLTTAWRLAQECLTEPAFPSDEVGRHVQQRLSEIDHELADAGARASLQWVDAFYDAESRAARPLGGTAGSVSNIGPDACRDFHARHVRPEGARVIVAGDVAADETIAGLGESLGRWQAVSATQEGRPAAPERLAANRSRTIFVDRPGSVQTEIHLGWQGPSRHVEGGWAPYPVLSFVIGGSPNARIDAVLREEKGYTYGMHASFRPRVDDGVFAASGSVRADATAASVELLLQILREADKGFTGKEIGDAVDFIGKTAPGRYATAWALTEEAGRMRFDGLRAPDFVTGYLRDLQQVTADSALEAWRRFSGQEPTIVLVGDAEEYADGVRALGLKVDVVDH